MKRYRLQIALSTLLLLLVGATIAIAVSQRTGSTPTATIPTGYGPYLTASVIPPGLAGRSVPGFDLTDARGGTLSSASFQGRPFALTFLYVHCVDVCPLIGSEIHAALADLGPKAKDMNVVAVSVDPHGDTRTAVQHWLSQQHEPSNFHYLIGSRRELAPVWKAFYVSPQTPGNPHSSHTAVIWLIDRHERVAALISAGVAINIDNLAHDFRVLINKS